MTTKTIRKPTRGAKPLDDEKMEQEFQWRSWFPQDIDWQPVLECPPEVVEPLVEGFRKFCADNIRVKHPSLGNVPLDLRDAQLETVRGWITNRYTIVLKARQIGFSTIASAFALWCVLGWPDREIVMLSKGEREAISLLGKARYAYRKLPDWVTKRGPYLIDKTKERMTFDNDSKIGSYPSNSDPARGESVFLVVVDEWGKFPNQEDAWASIEPITDIGGRVVSLGTANGEGNFFHRMWLGAEAGDNDFKGMFFPWWAVPERDDAWYKAKERNMEPWQLYQEYPSNAEEAFIGSGNPFFNLDLLRDMTLQEPVGDYTLVTVDETSNRYEMSQGGDIKIWEHPTKGHAYVIGADTAQGLDHGDWTVAHVMDATTGKLVAMYRGKCDPEDFGMSILPAMGFYYNFALVAPEVNNHGISTVSALKRRKYGRIFRRRTQLKRQETATETLGFLTTHTVKPKMMDELGVWLRDHNVPDRQTVQELKTFTRTQRGERVRLSGSPHDDCVMSLAITVQARKYAVETRILENTPESVPGSIDWYDRRLGGRPDRGRPRLKVGV